MEDQSLLKAHLARPLCLLYIARDGEGSVSYIEQ